MNEQIKNLIDSIKAFWEKQSKKGKTIILSSAGGLLVLAIVLVALMNRTKFVVLYPSLDNDEAIEVAQELKSRNVEHTKNGIKVPAEKEES